MGSNQSPERSGTARGEQPPFSARWATGKRLVVAAIILISIAGLFTTKMLREPPGVISAAPRLNLSTKPGERREIRLGDDAVVTMGGDSRIRYAVTAARTEVELSGVAHFKVAHSLIRMFEVRARNARVVDVGTDFIVRAYDADISVQVGVITGNVALDDVHQQKQPERHGRSAVQIVAGQSAALLPDGRSTPLSAMDEERYSGWMGSQLLLDDMTLRSAATEISHWFDVEIQIPDDALAGKHVTATFGRPVLSRVLDTISQSTGSRYEKKGRVIVFSRDGAR